MQEQAVNRFCSPDMLLCFRQVLRCSTQCSKESSIFTVLPLPCVQSSLYKNKKKYPISTSFSLFTLERRTMFKNKNCLDTSERHKFVPIIFERHKLVPIIFANSYLGQRIYLEFDTQDACSPHKRGQ